MLPIPVSMLLLKFQDLMTTECSFQGLTNKGRTRGVEFDNDTIYFAQQWFVNRHLNSLHSGYPINMWILMYSLTYIG